MVVFVRSLLINISILLIVSAISFEVLSVLLMELRLTPVIHRPLYGFSATDSWQDFYTENDPWGVWHKKNSVGRHVSGCFDVSFRFNSMGANDDEFSDSEGFKVIVLGDSFADGWGVNRKDRFDSTIEKAGIPVANLGSAGEMGVVSYYVLYKEFKNVIDHDAVVILFLPDNDFKDNDPNYYLPEQSFRFRPYFRRNGEEFEIFYTSQKPEKETNYRDINHRMALGNDLYTVLRGAAIKYTYSYGTYRVIKRIIQEYNNIGQYVGYTDPTEEQIAAAKYFLKKIVSEADGKPVILFSIPRLIDFLQPYHAINRSPVRRMLNDLKEELPNFTLLDGIEIMPQYTENMDALFLPCEGHWSPEGQKTAGTIIAKHLKKISAGR